MYKDIRSMMIMTCKHETLSCMSSLFCVQETISIGALNLLKFLHCHKGILVCNSQLDNLSSVLEILERNYIQIRKIDFLG